MPISRGSPRESIATDLAVSLSIPSLRNFRPIMLLGLGWAGNDLYSDESALDDGSRTPRSDRSARRYAG